MTFRLSTILILSILAACGGDDGTDPFVNTPPQAQFLPENSTGEAPLTILFDGSSSTPGIAWTGGSNSGIGIRLFKDEWVNDRIRAYEWDFGEGSTATGKRTSFEYTLPGEYLVSLTVTDKFGSSHQLTRNITVLEAFVPPLPPGPAPVVVTNEAPEANFTTSIQSATIPFTVDFDASTSIDNDDGIASWEWDFGDGSTGAGELISHQYTSPGIFIATLTVTDLSAESDSSSTDITASAIETYTISGTVFPAPLAEIDSDVNDPAANHQDNGANAQIINNPVILGGYSDSATDAADFFQVELEGDEDIVLTIANGVNLDITLLDMDLNIILSSTGDNSTSNLEVLTAAELGITPDTYIILVNAFTGHSGNYTLQIGENIAVSLSSENSFVPGQVLVRFKDENLQLIGENNSQYRAQSTGLQFISGDAGRAMLMSLGSYEQPSPLLNKLMTEYSKENFTLHHYTQLAITELQQRQDIVYAEPNYHSLIQYVPNDTAYTDQWNLPAINMPDAWDLTMGSAAVVTAVIDTGILASHPDLSGQISLDGYDFIADSSSAADSESAGISGDIDNNPEDIGDRLLPGGGSNFHGTHVAGIISAASDNNSAISGISWGSKIMPLRVSGRSKNANWHDVSQAVLYAAGLPNDSNTVPVQNADIINLSIGSTAPSSELQAALQDARAQGIIIVAAAGNNANDANVYPAAYPEVISVSSTNINNTISSFSSWGNTIDVAAPGGTASADPMEDITSLSGSDGADGNSPIVFGGRTLYGTSQSAPHVAGVAALMKSFNSSIDADLFEALLVSSQLTNDIGVPGKDDLYGYGLIDAHKALLAAQFATPGVPFLQVDPNELALGSIETERIITVSNGGIDTLTINSTSASDTWLTITPVSVDADGLGDYLVTIDRSIVVNGSYQGSITVSSSANELILPVSMIKAGVNNNADLGYHYIVLYDMDNNLIADVLGVAVDNGTYDFNFQNVSAGNYILIAGTDNNGDGIICDQRESCSAYPNIKYPESLNVITDIQDIDFETGYVTPSDYATTEYSLP